MQRVLIALAILLVAGCTAVPVVDAPSQNHNSRVNYLVLHFTSEHFAESLRLLTQHSDNPVSAHYLIPEPGDDTYDRRSIAVHRLVPEERRAWHAGKSYWAGKEALNDTSIGIEIVNRSACVDNEPETETPTPEEQACRFLNYPDEQIELVAGLAAGILSRYPDIDPVDVIGHADIAPDRRVDPGPLFPWKRLHEHGVGAWYDEQTVAKYRAQFVSDMPNIGQVQDALNAYGYSIEETGENDIQTRFVIRAFQMHFRSSDSAGQIDAETVAILYALIEKYRPELLENLLTAGRESPSSGTVSAAQTIRQVRLK